MRKTVRFSAIMAMLVVALLGSVMLRSVAAQDATPEPKDMGNCVTALKIGMEGDSCVNVIHLSPDAPAVDVWVDGAKAIEGLEFGKQSGWVALPAGEHQFTVTPAGEGADKAVIDVKAALEAGAGYEVAATGMVAAIAPQLYQVDFSMLEGDSARIRAIHTSPDAPAVDIAVKGGDVLVPALEFPKASDYLEVPAGSYDLEIRLAGMTDVVLPLDGVKLEKGGVYSVFAIGEAGKQTLTVIVDLVPSEGATLATPEATPSM